ncbi:MAG: hypothetical protein ACMVY4_06875 [Minwuia sp.]|uniref:hypothetical protein n=1 Tax=Minwuia sp. TaxID=2493630 RepID=UPI003A86CCF8
MEVLIGSEFDDTINTGGDITTIFAGGGNDQINFPFGGLGFGPALAISGGTGDDSMAGGFSTNDRFIFETGDGNDQVNGFQGGAGAGDVLDFSNDASITGLGDLTVGDDGSGNALIEYGAGDSITLLGVDFNNLDGDDFQF